MQSRKNNSFDTDLSKLLNTLPAIRKKVGEDMYQIFQERAIITVDESGYRGNREFAVSLSIHQQYDQYISKKVNK